MTHFETVYRVIFTADKGTKTGGPYFGAKPEAEAYARLYNIRSLWTGKRASVRQMVVPMSKKPSCESSTPPPGCSVASNDDDDTRRKASNEALRRVEHRGSLR